MSFRLILFIRFYRPFRPYIFAWTALLPVFEGHINFICGRTFPPPIVPLLTTSDQVCPSVCPSCTSTICPVSSTLSLNVDYALLLMFESSHNIATWYHPIITLLNLLNLLPCRVLVKKSSKNILVGQCLTLIFSCFTLLFTQKNLIPMCLYFLEHGFFHYLPYSFWYEYILEAKG